MFELLALSLALSVQTAPEAAPSPKPAKEAKICRREEPLVGSRLGRARQVCKTAAQWERERDDRQSDMRDAARGQPGS